MTPTCKSIGKLMHQTMRSLVTSMGIAFEEAGIPIKVEHYILLKIVHTHKGIIQQELAEVLMKDKSAVLRQINFLQKAGLLTRKPDPNDRRRNYVIMTQKGEALLKNANRHDAKTVEVLLQNVTLSEYKAFEKVLLSIQSNANTLQR